MSSFPYPVLATYTLGVQDNSVSIYVLCDPTTEEPFYVGRSIAPGSRLSQHWTSRYSSDVIQRLRQNGTPPVMHVVEIVPREQSRAAELEWINRLDEAGHVLVNQEAVEKRKRREWDELERRRKIIWAEVQAEYRQRLEEAGLQ